MPHAIQIRQTGGPEVLNWTPIEVGEPGSGAPAEEVARDAESALTTAQRDLATKRQEAQAIFALICEAHGIPEGTQVQIAAESKELVFQVSAAHADAPPA